MGEDGSAGAPDPILFGAILVLSWCFVGPFFDHVVAIASGSNFCRFWSCFAVWNAFQNHPKSIKNQVKNDIKF